MRGILLPNSPWAGGRGEDVVCMKGDPELPRSRSNVARIPDIGQFHSRELADELYQIQSSVSSPPPRCLEEASGGHRNAIWD